MPRYHIWRYDPYMPAEEFPWIVTTIRGDRAEQEPPMFKTWQGALTFVQWLLKNKHKEEK